MDSIDQGYCSEDETSGHGPKVSGARLPTDVSHYIGEIEIHAVSQVSGGQVFRQLLNGERPEITCCPNTVRASRRSLQASTLARAARHLAARLCAGFGLADRRAVAFRSRRFKKSNVWRVTKRFPHLHGAHRRFLLIAYPLRVVTQSQSIPV